MSARWIDLLDPTPEEVRAALPVQSRPRGRRCARARRRGDEHTRPLLEAHGAYVLGVFLAAQPLAGGRQIVVPGGRLRRDSRRSWSRSARRPPRERRRTLVRSRLPRHEAQRPASSSFASSTTSQRPISMSSSRSMREIDELEDHLDDWPSDVVRRRVGTCDTTSSMPGVRSVRREEPSVGSSTSASTSATSGSFRSP